MGVFPSPYEKHPIEDSTLAPALGGLDAGIYSHTHNPIQPCFCISSCTQRSKLNKGGGDVGIGE